MPTVKFGGPAHPNFSGLGPVGDSKTFTAIVDTVSNPDTDVTVVAKTNNPTIEYLVESA